MELRTLALILPPLPACAVKGSTRGVRVPCGDSHTNVSCVACFDNAASEPNTSTAPTIEVNRRKRRAWIAMVGETIWVPSQRLSVCICSSSLSPFTLRLFTSGETLAARCESYRFRMPKCIWKVIAWTVRLTILGMNLE